MHVLQAIRWGITAWDEVTPATIEACWIKARVLAGRYAPETRTEAEKRGWDEETHKQQQREHEMQAMIQKLAAQNRIKSAMSIDLFLNPVDEEIHDVEEDVLQSIAASYAEGNERDQETDEEEIIEPRIPEKEALAMLQRLRLYEEQQDSGDPAMVTRLNRYESTVRGRLIASHSKQVDITSFFSRKGS